MIISSLLIVLVYGEVDKTAFVTRVIDGDTFEISSGERIRLADVDCPEYYEYGYSQAKDYLTSQIDGKTVYLDIDDIYRTDRYGRLVCVVYVDYDSTHLMNVNKALLDGGYAVISNYNNEFSPYSWSLYLLKEVVPEPTQSPSPSITPTPTPTPELSSGFVEDYITVGIAIFAFVFVIAVLVMINRMDKTKEKTVVTNKEKPPDTTPKFYCRYCGVENKNDAVFCEKCGKNIR